MDQQDVTYEKAEYIETVIHLHNYVFNVQIRSEYMSRISVGIWEQS